MSTTTDSDAEFEIDLRELLLSVADSYRYMELSAKRYALVVLLPAFAFAVGTTLVTVFVPVDLSVGLPLVGLGLLAVVVAVFYPKVVQDRRSKEIRERFHLFLTHITVLSMTNIERVEIFRTLAEVDEYGALADEMGHVVALVDTWNQSLDDACRMRSKRVDSDLLADFLERLAYAVGAGQNISDFLVDEQDSILQQFVIRYESDLAKLDVLKELYLSMMLSTTFILVFATVLPLLLGVSPLLLVGGVVVMFVIVQGGFLFVIHTISPWDPVWFHSEAYATPASNVRNSLLAGIGLTLGAATVALGVAVGVVPLPADAVPTPIVMSGILSPLLIPGILMRREEQRVKDRDRGFPSFIRALGSVESVKQTSTVNVLSTLRNKDFGALTRNVDNLYRRLNLRISTTRSWRLFAAETGSYLIQKFGDMYVVGRRMGGDPKVLGQVISKNFGEVLRVREQRTQATSTFIGVMYGITAASVFSAFIGLAIAEQMLAITESIDSNNELMSLLFSPEVYDVATIEVLLLVVVLVNALLSSLMIRLIDRGHMINAYVHFVALTWIGSVVAVVTQVVAGQLINM
jgi:flagellar protein FlaJ